MDIEEYNRRVENEKKFYEKEKYKEDLTEKASSGLAYVLHKFQERVRENTGSNVWDHFVSIVNEKSANNKEARILSLGSGPGGTEMNLIKRVTGKYFMECIDINDESVKIGQDRANIEGLNLKFIQQDINKIMLQPNTYDLVFAHASLHHMINHEHISLQIKNSLKDDGLFLIYDVIVRNGMRMWDNTKDIANSIFAKLPLKYRFNSLAIEENKRYSESLPDTDVSIDSFECIRSQDLYPILKKNFKTKIEVPGFSFARRFVDIPFGENYDVENNPFDKAIIDTIVELDEKYTNSNKLKPESIFLILGK
ncbi:MAG: class I SAM-dependent methyltransferase [Nitrososphaera sp.]|jgi:SAM-dependent methyltransferase